MAATLVVAFSSPGRSSPRARPRNAGGYSPPYAAMVVDAKTGRVLHAENEDALRHPASITKVMTLYLLFEQLEAGRVTLDTPLRGVRHAARQAPSKLGLDSGETIEVEDAILALVTKSANDIAVVVAENIAGVGRCLRRADDPQGAPARHARTVYRNASGLPDPEQVTTARDLSILGARDPGPLPADTTPISTTRVFQLRRRQHPQPQPAARPDRGRRRHQDRLYRAPPASTSLTNVKTDGRHVVAVVLGGRSGASRDTAMASLDRAEPSARLCRRPHRSARRRRQPPGPTPRRASAARRRLARRSRPRRRSHRPPRRR